MDPIALCAREALSTHPDPALRLSELLGLVVDRIGRRVDEGFLRGLLEHRDDCFRVLDTWPGRWNGPGAPSGAGDPWVVLVGDVPDPAAAADAVGTLRESVRWLARGIDDRSQMSVSRWCSIVLAERSTRDAIRRAA